MNEDQTRNKKKDKATKKRAFPPFLVHTILSFLLTMLSGRFWRSSGLVANKGDEMK